MARRTRSGSSAQWARALGSRHRVLLGAEAHHVSGTTEEQAIARGAVTSVVEAGGDEMGAALYAQDLIQLHPRLVATASLRFDAWWLRDGRSTTTPVATGIATTTEHPDREETRAEPAGGPCGRRSHAWRCR